MGRYYGRRRYYRRSKGSPEAGGIAILIILLIANVKAFVGFALIINAFIIMYYTARYKISSKYNLESLDTYKRRFLYSVLVALVSLVYSIIFKTNDIKDFAIANVVFAIFTYITISLLLLLINWLKPKLHNKITKDKNELGKTSNREEFNKSATFEQQKGYGNLINDEIGNIDMVKSDFEFHIPDKTDAELKGEYGELIIAGVLSKLPAHYKVMNGVLLEYEPNTYSQIDHLVISNFGIFVIESKNYSGYIFGRAQDNDWTQVLFGRNNEKKSYHMPNPIKQNISHIKALQNVLTGFPAFYHNIVVFTGNCKIERTEGSTPIVHVMKLLETIRDLSQIQYLSNEQVAEIFSIISSFNKPEMINEHVERLNNFRTS